MPSSACKKKRRQNFPASRIATQLDRFPLSIPHLLRPLLIDVSTPVRVWAAALLARYAATAEINAERHMLAEYREVNVRKSIVETQGNVGGVQGVDAAQHLFFFFMYPVPAEISPFPRRFPLPI